MKLVPTTINDYGTFLKSKKCKLDSIFQRNLVWNKKEGMQLVNSLLSGYPIGQIDYAIINGIWNCTDGRQRSNTIYLLLNDKLTYQSQYLDKLNTSVLYDELDGFVFSQWPTIYQNRIKNTIIAVWSKITTEEIASSMFRILNIYMNKMKQEEIVYSNQPRSGMNTLKKTIAKHSYWDKVFSLNARNRKETEHVIGIYIKDFVIGIGHQSKGLASFMKRHSDADTDAIKGAGKEIVLYRDILDQCLPSKNGYRTNLYSKSAQYALFYLMHEMYSDGKKVKSMNYFREKLKEVHIKLNAKDYTSSEVDMYKNSTMHDRPDGETNRRNRITALKCMLIDCFE